MILVLFVTWSTGKNYTGGPTNNETLIEDTYLCEYNVLCPNLMILSRVSNPTKSWKIEYNFKWNQPNLSRGLNLNRDLNSLNSASVHLYKYCSLFVSNKRKIHRARHFENNSHNPREGLWLVKIEKILPRKNNENTYYWKCTRSPRKFEKDFKLRCWEFKAKIVNRNI